MKSKIDFSDEKNFENIDAVHTFQEMELPKTSINVKIGHIFQYVHIYVMSISVRNPINNID